MTRRSDLPSLTGLRFVAASAVLGFHLSFWLAGTPLRHLKPVLGQGRIGVDFFFVLSGFILTWSHRQGDSPASFYRRRFARVYPNHLVVLALLVAHLVIVGNRPSGRQVLETLLLVQAWDPDPSQYFAINIVAWTLSCELFFYLAFPFVLPFLRALGTRAAVGVLALLAAGWTALGLLMSMVDGTHANGSRLYWVTHLLPPVRFTEFLIGMAAAQLVSLGTLRLPVLPVASATGALYLLSLGWRGAEVAAHLIAPAFALLIAALAHRDVSRRGSWITSRAMVTLGGWSYALYLVHVSVLLTLLRLLGVPSGAASGLLLVACCVVGSIAAAGLLFHVVERPAERRLRGAPRRPEELAAL